MFLSMYKYVFDTVISLQCERGIKAGNKTGIFDVINTSWFIFYLLVIISFDIII